MKTKVQKALVRFSGLFGLSLLMVAAGAQAAHAAVVEGTGSGSGSVVSSTSYAMIAGIAGGAVVAALIIAGVVWSLARRRQHLGRFATATNSASRADASVVQQPGSVTNIAPTAETSAAQQADKQADSQRKAA
jgi:hypothetical protein